jgi:hypothetical protein
MRIADAISESTLFSVGAINQPTREPPLTWEVTISISDGGSWGVVTNSEVFG